MPLDLPADAQAALGWTWDQLAPHYAALAKRPLTAANVDEWLLDWSQLASLVGEIASRLHVTYDMNTADPERERAWFAYLENIAPKAHEAGHGLSQKLLAAGLEPEGMAVPLRDMRAEAALFREVNLPLLTEHAKLGAQYDKIIGAQTVTWEGEEVPLPKLRPVGEDPDRARRERAWWLVRERQLADRQAINDLWKQMLPLRGQIAANAGCADYREYAWQDKLRFDYTPADCATFHDAIEAVVVPAATRIYEKHRRRLGLDTLRPWDLSDGNWERPAPPPGQTPLKPYQDVETLLATTASVLNRVDAHLGGHWATMRREQLLDLENRKGKAPGGYCTYFPTAKRPFIFMNAVGLHNDVQVLLHEAGHAFHAFEASQQRYVHQMGAPLEFSEVASMGMELLAGPYLARSEGGFYSEAEAARARAEHLEEIILFWPYMAVVDAFQHWVYTHLDQAQDPDQCDATWRALWQRFIPAVDWSGLEAELVTGWHRKLHIFRVPLYYVEYGLARLGAVQVWGNALRDREAAIAGYRRALALGGTATLPQLYQAAGARFAFDVETVGRAVALVEETLEALDPA